MPTIISDSLYLSALNGTAVPLTHARIMYDTHTLAPGVIVTGTTEAAGFEADSVLNPDTYSRWVATSNDATLTFDFGSPKPADYLMIAGHNFAKVNCTVLVEYSADGLAWSAAAPDRTFANNRAAAYLFEEITARYWRVVCTGGAPSIAVVYIGTALAMQRPLYGGHSPMNLARSTKFNSTTSEGGQFLGQSIIRQGLRGSFSWNNLSANWYRQFFDPFVLAARGVPFGITWRPEEFPDEVAYVKMVGDVTPSNSGTRDLMSVSFNCIGFDED